VPCFIVTGPRGTGKSLHSVKRIRDALMAGCPVATNLDLYVEHLTGGRKDLDLRRLPDHPTYEDFERLGMAYEGRKYDESRFGWVVLDEAAVFLNARDWNGKMDSEKEAKKTEALARRRLMQWLRFSRKFRWHLLIISQDFESLDPEARRALAEMIVECRRLDNYAVPIISTLVKMLGFKAVSMPQIHLALVRDAKKMSGPPVDRWAVNPMEARALHAAYNTEQKLSAENDGPATMLDARHAAYLWEPRGLRETLWKALLWRWLPPSLARSRYDDFRLYEQGLLSPYKPQPSYAEWLAARAERSGPLGAEGGEAAGPAQAEPALQHAA